MYQYIDSYPYMVTIGGVIVVDLVKLRDFIFQNLRTRYWRPTATKIIHSIADDGFKVVVVNALNEFTTNIISPLHSDLLQIRIDSLYHDRVEVYTQAGKSVYNNQINVPENTRKIINLMLL